MFQGRFDKTWQIIRIYAANQIVVFTPFKVDKRYYPMIMAQPWFQEVLPDPNPGQTPQSGQTICPFLA